LGYGEGVGGYVGSYGKFGGGVRVGPLEW